MNGFIGGAEPTPGELALQYRSGASVGAPPRDRITSVARREARAAAVGDDR